eukprot:scaffold14741_cov55-Phaeocystis_antarctica.AAC.1
MLWLEAAGLLHHSGQGGGTPRNTHLTVRARLPGGGGCLLERAAAPLEARPHRRRPRAAPPSAAALALPGQPRRRRPHAVTTLQ